MQFLLGHRVSVSCHRTARVRVKVARYKEFTDEATLGVTHDVFVHPPPPQGWAFTSARLRCR